MKANPCWKQKRKSIWKGKDEKKAYGRDRKSSATSLSSENNDKWAELGSHWVLLKGRRSWCRCADYCRQRKCIDKGNYRKEVAGWVADRSKKTERKKKDLNLGNETKDQDVFLCCLSRYDCQKWCCHFFPVWIFSLLSLFFHIVSLISKCTFLSTWHIKQLWRGYPSITQAVFLS